MEFSPCEKVPLHIKMSFLPLIIQTSSIQNLDEDEDGCSLPPNQRHIGVNHAFALSPANVAPGQCSMEG